MVRIRGSLEILQVTRHARGAFQSVVIVDVAIGALPRWHSVQPCQGKAGCGVVELCIGPLHRVVTLLACIGEAAVRHRAHGAGEILLVTGEASAGGQVVIVIDMAIYAQARRNRVASGQKEAGRAVVKLGVQPVVCGVTALTSGRELGGNVVRVGSRLKICQVAGDARRRHDLELAVGAVLVAGIAVNRCVGTGQRETIVVLLNIFNSDSPSADGVALLAIRAQLSLVNIGVAVLAALTDAGEDHFDMALSAGHGSVHTAQRIASLIVIELGNRADRFPPIRSVAILAGKGETAVRTVRAFRDLRPRNAHESAKGKDQNENYF